jgi:transcriptional regulator
MQLRFIVMESSKDLGEIVIRFLNLAPGAPHHSPSGEVAYNTPSFSRKTSLAKQLELLQSTLDMLILKALSLGSMHGYGVLLRIQQISGDLLAIPQGSLYPALYRLEHHGLIASEWGASENKRKAKYYSLTTAGRRQVKEETHEWRRMTDTIAAILNTVPEQR